MSDYHKEIDKLRKQKMVILALWDSYDEREQILASLYFKWVQGKLEKMQNIEVSRNKIAQDKSA